MLEKTFHFISELTQSLFTFLKILLRSKLIIQIPRAETEECIILGNGPSLNAVLDNYAEELSKKTLICVNKFPDTTHFKQLKPAYFIFVSPQYWEKEHSDPNSPERNKIIEALIKNTNWDLNVLCPYRAIKNPHFLHRLKQNPCISITFFNDTPLEGLEKINQWFLNKRWGTPRPHNVIIPAVLMAIQLGFRNIYLLGADHSWLPMITVNDSNEALINRKHFYDEQTAKAERMYNLEQNPRHLHEILEKFVYTFKAYFKLDAYAKSKGVNIWNATPNSYIDAFERKHLNEIFKSHPNNELQ